MDRFIYSAGTSHIIFGRGEFSKISAVVEKVGSGRALILVTEQQKGIANLTAKKLGDNAAGIFSRAAMHTPVEVTEEALAYCESVKANCLVSVGGGSTTGLGKAIAYRTRMPHIVVPTTYAGSEVTPILGQTENKQKTTIKDQSVLPDAVIYDPELTDGLPLKMSIVSGLNAMAHAAEALYTKDRNPVSSMLAVEGFSATKIGLELIAKDQFSMEGRDSALYGAWLCGTVLGQVGMALHHKICHTLGGSFDMPHAETHAVMFPHTLAFNAKSANELLRPISDVFKGEIGSGLYDFAKEVSAPLTLKELGFRAEDLNLAAEIASRNPYWNPQPIDQAGLRSVLQNAFDGSRPE